MELGQVSSPLSGASIKSKGRLFFLMNKCSCANVTQIGRNLPRRILPGIEGDQDINACKTNVPIQSRSVSWVPVVCPALIHPSRGAGAEDSEGRFGHISGLSNSQEQTTQTPKLQPELHQWLGVTAVWSQAAGLSPTSVHCSYQNPLQSGFRHVAADDRGVGRAGLWSQLHSSAPKHPWLHWSLNVLTCKLGTAIAAPLPHKEAERIRYNSRRASVL